MWIKIASPIIKGELSLDEIKIVDDFYLLFRFQTAVRISPKNQQIGNSLHADRRGKEYGEKEWRLREVETFRKWCEQI